MRASGRTIRSVLATRRDTVEDVIFNIVTTTIIILGCLVVLYPLYFILIASISDPFMVLSGKVVLIPRDVDLGGYERILRYDQLWIGSPLNHFLSVIVQ